MHTLKYSLNLESQLHSKKLHIITHSIFLHVSKNLQMILQTLLFFELKNYPLILHFCQVEENYHRKNVSFVF